MDWGDAGVWGTYIILSLWFEDGENYKQVMYGNYTNSPGNFPIWTEEFWADWSDYKPSDISNKKVFRIEAYFGYGDVGVIPGPLFVSEIRVE
jgi:hypothetical protein